MFEKICDTTYARAPQVETAEVRIITGSIIPLWQRLKAKGDTRLRVIRVSTVDGQRIVGVEILRSRVGAVLRSLGLGDWPQILKPSFRGVLREGEEIELRSEAETEHHPGRSGSRSGPPSAPQVQRTPRPRTGQ